VYWLPNKFLDFYVFVAKKYILKKTNIKKISG
jgi:hypothetical protein